MITADAPFLVPPGQSRISREKFIALLREMANPGLITERDPGQYYDANEAITTTDGRHVDHLFLLGMFSHESNMGKKGVARTTKSWGNTRTPNFGAVPVGAEPGASGSFPIWRDWMDGMKSTAWRLVTDQYVYNGTSKNPKTGQIFGPRTTIREVFDHPSTLVWAPAGDMNDPAGYLRAMLDFMNRYTDQEGGMPGPQDAPAPVHILVSAGHWDSTGDEWGGVERARTRPLAIAVADEAERRGFRVTRQVDPFDGTYRDVARWAAQVAAQQDIRCLLQVHFEGTAPSVRGAFGIYPANAARFDTDHDARRLGQDIVQRLNEATGMPVRGDGSMAEGSTAAGTLAWFSLTVNVKATAERLIVEYGAANTNAQDRAIVDTPGFYQQAARATVDALEAFYGVQPRPPADDAVRMFPETGHGIGGGFRWFWEHNGGLPIFGYPLTDELVEDGRTVQYFERAVFEYWPENPPEWHVLLRRLGAEALARREDDAA